MKGATWGVAHPPGELSAAARPPRSNTQKCVVDVTKRTAYVMRWTDLKLAGLREFPVRRHVSAARTEAELVMKSYYRETIAGLLAAERFYSSPECTDSKKLRLSSTEGWVAIARELTAPN
jgi:hypothetical protein